MTKIVILDGHTATGTDLKWEEMPSLGEVTVYPRTPADKVLARCQDAEVVLTNKVLITDEVMAKLPKLRYVGVLATGYNVVDTEAASKRGIVVTNVPAYSTMSVAQTVMAHLLNITNYYASRVKAGDWQRAEDFCFYDTELTELDGLTMGIVGLGHTGKATARMAQAMGMKVMAVSGKSAEDLEKMEIEKATGLDELFTKADVVSLHCPLCPDTFHLVSAERLRLMKPSAILINTGRGPLVDEEALAEALRKGSIRAAAMDVLSQEPPQADCPLIGAPNCYITPHVAWASQAARRRLIQVATANVKHFLDGHTQNQVN